MDIDWQEHTLTVNEVQMWVKGELVVKGPKTASSVRTIPLPAWLISDIAAAMDRRSDQTGAPILANRPLVHVADRQTNARPHNLADRERRPRIGRTPPLSPLRPPPQPRVAADQSWAHPKAISERMGHTEIGVTMNVYGHLFEGAQGQLTKDLDDLLERSRPKTLGEGGKRGGRGVKRACHTGQQRSLAVSNGHSKTAAELGESP
jgi:integrase